MQVEIYTDGSCSGNPGPGGWAFIIKGHNVDYQQFGSSSQTTNNQMELKAVIMALSVINKPRIELEHYEIIIYTDSQYVKNGINNWIKRWRLNGWRTAEGGAVKNKELWEMLYLLTKNFPNIEWRWVKGHSNNTYNNRCDELARKAYADLLRKTTKSSDKTWQNP